MCIHTSALGIVRLEFIDDTGEFEIVALYLIVAVLDTKHNITEISNLYFRCFG